MIEKTTSEVMSMIMGGYLANYCEGCPFFGIKEFEIEQICDSVPLNCKWMALWQYFKEEEENEKNEEDEPQTDCAWK